MRDAGEPARVIGPICELAEIDLDRWRAMLDVNLTGALALCRAVLPAMKRQGSGRIINISGLAHRVQPGLGAYSAGKAALAHLSNVMDAENRADGVRVFSVEPGVVRTEMNESLLSQEPTGIGAAVIQMLERMRVSPGYVDADQSARLIQIAATGEADELAGQDCSIYDTAVRSRITTLSRGRPAMARDPRRPDPRPPRERPCRSRVLWKACGR